MLSKFYLNSEISKYKYFFIACLSNTESLFKDSKNSNL